MDSKDCRFDCGVTTTDRVPAECGIGEMDIPGSLTLRMQHIGDYDLIHVAVDGLYREAVLADLPIAALPLLIHYLDDPEEVPFDQQRALIYIPLEGASSACPPSICGGS
ncbi:GyrI-like domain-containing protein [Croceicoccus sp. YJ47]|uniref:GyrI-like domain-containing protein n=1 Tax=Croceicoccus sp. YJ47 TaxID=2798724 RepID=UPI001F25F258|nr:GyrI-like domain-containing protein [Croceicoccus sp. YJ47]